MFDINCVIMQQEYTFVSFDGKARITLSDEQLDKYPDCFFDCIVRQNFDGDKTDDGEFKTKLTSESFKQLANFFENGTWINHHMNKSPRLEIVGESYSFEDVCDFLYLPYNLDIIEDPDDSDDPDDPYGGSYHYHEIQPPDDPYDDDSYDSDYSVFDDLRLEDPDVYLIEDYSD